MKIDYAAYTEKNYVTHEINNTHTEVKVFGDSHHSRRHLY